MKIEVARIKEYIDSAERINLGRDHGCFIGVFACRSLLAQTAIDDVQQGGDEHAHARVREGKRQTDQGERRHVEAELHQNAAEP